MTHLLIRTKQIQSRDLPGDQQNKIFFDEKLLEENNFTFDWSQVAHFDEIHIDQQAKHVSSDGQQIRFRRDENGKVMQPSQFGGTYRKLTTETTFKFAKDARFCLGVAKVSLLNSDGGIL